MKLLRITPLIIAAIPSLATSEIILRKGGILLDHQLSRQGTEETTHSLPKPDPAGSDILLFENGDLMHGSFGGMHDGILWERTDISRPIKFGIPGVRQLVLKGGEGVGLDEKTSFVTLIGGDRIPGQIVSLNDKVLSLKSPVAGDLEIPRVHLKSISPNPFDGELFYAGPYTSTGWMTLDHKKTEAQLEKEAEAKKKTAEEGGAKKKKSEKSSPWIHSGAAFYSLGTRPLVMPDADLPEVGRIRFKAAWKGRLNITLALHSDFVRVLPAPKKEKENEKEEEEPAEPDGEDAGKPNPNEDPADEIEAKEEPLRKESLLDLRKGAGFQNISWINSTNRSHADIYGTGYTMTIYSSFPSLSRNEFSETGIARSQRLSTTRSSMSLSESGDAEIEIRYDRKKALVMLFVNGAYAAQWNDVAGYAGNGKGFGIANNTSSAHIKISDITFTSWNGMTDSARSMNHPERDVALLTNGTDRFSGKLSHIADGLAHFKTGYSDVRIPTSELSRIIMNESSRTDLDDEKAGGKYAWKDEPITVLYKPYGRIKISPTSATKETLQGSSPFLGKISVDLKSANILRFVETSPDISVWFDDF